MFLKPQQKASQQQPRHVVDPALQPWVEKYRPKTIEEVSSQDHAVAVLRKTLASTNLPHMLFYGPPGTGKTSTILALSRQLFGPNNFRHRVLELNASDERGINIVRDKIKEFAKQTPKAAEEDKNYPCPPYKIVILDEADSMTQDAQGALRRIMETYAKTTRFCLVCNYVTRIIEPLTSRCSKFRFKPLDTSSTTTRLAHIASAENITVDNSVLSALVKVSNGDLRRSITYLQSASRLSSSTNPPTPITARDIQEIAGTVPDSVIEEFASVLGIDLPKRGGGEDAMDVDDVPVMPQRAKFFVDVRTKVKQIIREGYSASQILSQLHDLVILHPTLDARRKAKCAAIFGEVDKSLVDGGDEELLTLELGLQVWKAMA